MQVISRKDQGQYWLHQDIPHSFVSVDALSKRFKELETGRKIEDALSKPYDKSKTHKDALSFSDYSLPKWELFRACISREFLLMKRNSFVYLFKTFQVTFFVPCVFFQCSRVRSKETLLAFMFCSLLCQQSSL